MFGRLGPLELGLIIVIILIIFGAGKLPQVGGAIGRAIREFRKAEKGEDREEPEESGPAKRTGGKARKSGTKS